MFSLISVHGCLGPLLWACGEAEHHGGKHLVGQSSSPHDSQETKRADVYNKALPQTHQAVHL
jgi:hypothetical protein